MDYKKLRQAKAIEATNRKRLLKINPKLDDGSGIYFLTRTDENGISYDIAAKQLCCTGTNGAALCVSNPAAPEPDGLANDIETLMLPTLWIKEDESGDLYAVETEYTKKYLYGE